MSDVDLLCALALGYTCGQVLGTLIAAGLFKVAFDRGWI